MPTLTDANVRVQPQENSMVGGVYKYRIQVTFSDRRSIVAINYTDKPNPTTGWIHPRGKK